MLFSSKNSSCRPFLFIHIPKSAGSSIRRTLFPYSSKKQIFLQLINHASFVLSRRYIMSNPVYKYHPHAKHVIDHLGLSVYTRYYTFAITRNPLSRLISMYTFLLDKKTNPMHGLVKNKSFDEFISYCIKEKPLFIYQNIYTHYNGHSLVNRLAKLENIGYDFKGICEDIEIKPPNLKFSNKSDYSKSETLHLSESNFEEILHVLAMDYEYYDYSLTKIPSSISLV